MNQEQLQSLAVLALDIAHPMSSTAPLLTVSIGVASRIPSSTELPNVLIAQADEQLYDAKRQGRNRAMA